MWCFETSVCVVNECGYSALYESDLMASDRKDSDLYNVNPSQALLLLNPSKK